MRFEGGVKRFEGRAVVVSGGGSGIGRASAMRLAQEGARVALLGRRVDVLASAARAIQGATGGEVVPIRCDVTDAASVDSAIAAAAERLGPLHVAVAAAGVSAHTPFLEADVEESDRIIATNLRGVLLLDRAVARLMTETGDGGVIVNVASTSGFAADDISPEAVYDASKAAVVRLTKSLAVELAPHGIRVNAVSPGWTHTPMSAKTAADPERFARYLAKIPLRRFGEPEEIASAVAYLASAEASFITGANLVVDGGELCL